jgi:hypothetical protein
MTNAERFSRYTLIRVRAAKEAIIRQLEVLRLAEQYHAEQVQILERDYLSENGDGI